MKKWCVILVVSMLLNILVVGYIMKKEVRINILFNDYLVNYIPSGEKINYDEINGDISLITDEEMALRLVEAYLGDHLNYTEESDPLFTATVSFDEEKYEYLVEIILEQQAGKYTGTVKRYLVGIRKDYGIVTFYVPYGWSAA